MFEDLFRAWDGEEGVVRFDAGSGSWIFVCVHSTVRGPAAGGTRMKTYAAPADGLADAMQLSAAMTRKMAVVRAPLGGGKAVLAVPALPQGDDRRRLLHLYGDLVASLGGTFRTAGDLNTTPADLDVIAERCAYVYGRPQEHGGAGDSGIGTARGVFHGIRASLDHVFGSPELAGRRVVVQGVGSVGAELARLLAQSGVEVVVSDLAGEAARTVASTLGAAVVEPDDAPAVECDVFAPCAVGGTISAQIVPGLRCRIVAGSANNQLASPADALRLQEAGILYAPDYVINAGGVLQLLGIEDLGWDDDELERRLVAIGDSLREVYARAAADGTTTAEAADRLADERLTA
jgi:leucine dehydrogenase